MRGKPFSHTHWVSLPLEDLDEIGLLDWDAPSPPPSSPALMETSCQDGVSISPQSPYQSFIVDIPSHSLETTPTLPAHVSNPVHPQAPYYHLGHQFCSKFHCNHARTPTSMFKLSLHHLVTLISTMMLLLMVY